MSTTQYDHARGILVLVVVVVCIPLLSQIVSMGRQHVEAASIAGLANEAWQRGNYTAAVAQYMDATRLTLEGGTRSLMAEPFIRGISMWEQQGNLLKALEYCQMSVRILGPYDVEGSLDYGCMVLQYQIESQIGPTQSP